MIPETQLTHEKPGMRRAPQRARGQQKVNIILNTADLLFAEVGYEATTTNAIAARAQISIGSLYQFFPNKEAILYAVVARYCQGLRAVYNDWLTPEMTKRPISELIDQLMTTTLEFGMTHPGMTHIFLQAHTSEPLAMAVTELQGEITRALENILTAHAPWLPSTDQKLYATVAVTAMSAVLSIAIRIKTTLNEAFGYRLIEEAKTMLVVYLEAVIREKAG